MPLSRGLVFGIGLGVILASGLLLADDVISLDVLPGSSISVGTQSFPLGDDPPTSAFNNVSVGDDGTVFGAQADISFVPIDGMMAGFTFHIQMRPQSDLAGTYDRTGGSLTASVAFDLKITSNAPGFDNNNCIVPASAFSFSTDDIGGSTFSGGQGIIVDNAFVVNAIPPGSCGSFFGTDCARLINGNFGLPSPSGNNMGSLIIRMSPALIP